MQNLKTNENLVPSRFGFDRPHTDESTVPGWHNPTRQWNGWACPLLTLANIARWLDSDQVNFLEGEFGDGFVWGVARDESEVWAWYGPEYTWGDTPYSTDPDLILIRTGNVDPNTREPLYDVGQGLCWESASPSDDLVRQMYFNVIDGIAAMLRDGDLPLNFHRTVDPDFHKEVGSMFSRLHDYCDANFLFGCEDEQEDDGDLWMACAAIVSGFVGDQLRQGGHLRGRIFKRVESLPVTPDGFGVEKLLYGTWTRVGPAYDTGDDAYFAQVGPDPIRVVALPTDCLEFGDIEDCGTCGQAFNVRGDCRCGPEYEFGEVNEGYLWRAAPQD